MATPTAMPPGDCPSYSHDEVDGKPVVTQVEIINAASVGSEDGGDAGGGLPEFMPPQALVFGSGPGDLGALVDRATSLSCSLGSAMVPVMSPLLESLPKCPPEDQPLLFCCENDHAAVMKLKKKFADKVRPNNPLPSPCSKSDLRHFA